MASAEGQYAKGTSNEGVKYKIIKFKLQVPQLQLPGGWKFIGRVDHEEIGNLIVSVPGSGHEEDLHKLFGKSQPSHCDHCGKTRNRTSTFVVKDENGKIKRIGRQCLKDYLPGGEREVQKMVDYAAFLTRIALGLAEFESAGGEDSGEGGEGMGGGGGRYNHFGVEAVLGLTFSIVDAVGYLSKSKARAQAESGESSGTPTADIVEQAFTGELGNRVERIGLNKLEGGLKLQYDAYMDWRGDSGEKGEGKFRKKAKEAIEWGTDYVAKQLAAPGHNPMREFYQNLSIILNGVKDKEEAYVSKKYLGYLTSLVPLYKKHIETEAQNKDKASNEKVSEYVGMVGYPIGDLNATDKRKLKKEGFADKLDKFPFNGPIPVTINMFRVFERDSYSYYDSGVSYMYSMSDDNGNIYVCFSTRNWELDQGDKVKILKAKVKNHKDFVTKAGKTIKQTYITRASVSLPDGSEQTE
jgi:hypothetical protein